MHEINPGVDLSLTYSVDPREFVEIFVAFAVNNAKNSDVTDSTLDDFERKELANQKSAAQKAKNATRAARNMDFEYNEIGSDDEGDEVMGAYICTTPKVCDMCFQMHLFSKGVSKFCPNFQ